MFGMNFIDAPSVTLGSGIGSGNAGDRLLRQVVATIVARLNAFPYLRTLAITGASGV